MTITNEEFDKKYLNKTIEGKYNEDGSWVPPYRYRESDRALLTGTNKSPKGADGKQITLDSIKKGLDELREMTKEFNLSTSIKPNINEMEEIDPKKVKIKNKRVNLLAIK